MDHDLCVSHAINNRFVAALFLIVVHVKQEWWLAYSCSNNEGAVQNYDYICLVSAMATPHSSIAAAWLISCHTWWRAVCGRWRSELSMRIHGWWTDTDRLCWIFGGLDLQCSLFNSPLPMVALNKTQDIVWSCCLLQKTVPVWYHPEVINRKLVVGINRVKDEMMRMMLNTHSAEGGKDRTMTNISRMLMLKRRRRSRMLLFFFLFFMCWMNIDIIIFLLLQDSGWVWKWSNLQEMQSTQRGWWRWAVGWGCSASCFRLLWWFLEVMVGQCSRMCKSSRITRMRLENMRSSKIYK